MLVLRRLHTAAAATPVTLLTSLVWVAALTLLAPPVLWLTGAAVAMVLRGFPSASGYLAATNLRTGARRYASVAMPVLLTVSMSATILFMHTSLDQAAQQQATAGVQASYVRRAPNPGLPSAAADAARRTPGMDTVTQIVRSTVRDAGLSKSSVQGVTPAGLGQNLDLGVRTGPTSPGEALATICGCSWVTTTDRAHEFATLRLIGTTRRQIRAMTLSEGVLLAIVGAALGTMISVLTLSGYSTGMTGSAPHIPALPCLTIIGGAAALTLGATTVATREALGAAQLNVATAPE